MKHQSNIEALRDGIVEEMQSEAEVRIEQIHLNPH